MHLFAGTSGFSYKEWCRGVLSRRSCRRARCWPTTRQRLPTVEINNTFYRMPTAALLEGWRSQVPESFRFAVKTPRRISHVKRLKDCGDDFRVLLKRSRRSSLASGSLLVQLPPFFKVTIATCSRRSSASCRRGVAPRSSFATRHGSCPKSTTCSRVAQSGRSCRARRTTVSRRRRGRPTGRTCACARSITRTPDLDTWLARLRAAALTSAHVFFKHEDAATGPKLAAKFLERAA